MHIFLTLKALGGGGDKGGFRVNGVKSGITRYHFKSNPGLEGNDVIPSNF